jgi:hypothetical protein
MANLDQLAQGYDALNKSAIGQHLRGWIEQERNATLNRAEKALTLEESFGLTKTSYAYTVILRHLDSMAMGDKLVNRK